MIIAKCTVNYLLFMQNNQSFDEKYKYVTYSDFPRSRLNLSHFISLHKNFMESTLKTTVTEHIHCIMFYFHFSMNVHWVEAQVSYPGVVICHLEVKVT